MRYFLSLLLVVVLFIGCGGQPADMVIHNGKVVTVDEDFTIAEAVAVSGDRIIWTGSNSEAQAYIGSDTKVIDLNGAMALPGLIDGHAHYQGFGAALQNLDLVGTTSFQAIIDLVAEKVATSQPGDWIIGRGWDQNDWNVQEFPLHDALSKISPDNPVWLERVDGHAGIANTAAMEVAGIDRETLSPAGGKIHAKRNGDPTGVFVDNAMDTVNAVVPPLSDQQFTESVKLAAQSCLEVGLTGVHDAGIGSREVTTFKYLIDMKQFPVRIYGMLSDPGEKDAVEYFNNLRVDNYKDFLTVNSVKLYSDGALGSRGAAMLEPYTDDPHNHGLNISTPEHIFDITRTALSMGIQVNTHAIGDRGNREVLDAYEKALKENPTNDHRFRIEHAQIVALGDIPRFAALGILPAMQATHATSDMYWAEERVGSDRIAGAYAWQEFIKTGLPIPGGSDFPVESNDPRKGLYASITRQDVDGYPPGGWLPDQRMTREQAIRSFTIWAAYGAFQEDILGSIEVGKFADFTIFDRDILKVPAIEILTAEILYTIVGGDIKYQAK